MKRVNNTTMIQIQAFCNGIQAIITHQRYPRPIFSANGAFEIKWIYF